MKASVITTPGKPEVLVWKDSPTPVAGVEEVLIEVKAAGINRADLSQREGKYPAPAGAPADVPGLEVAGVVKECGEGVTMWKPGDEICALLEGGGYAEFVVVKEGQCLPIPTGFNFIEAAGLPETVFTVWSNIFERGALQPGETLLIHGGSSGIGTTAIQIAKALRSKVIVTAGTQKKGQDCLDLGADVFINYKKQDFEKELKDDGVDVILDMIGGDYFQKNLNILKPDGRLVYINSMSGDKVNLSIKQVMQKRLIITGSTLRSREYSFKKKLTSTIKEKVWPLLENAKFKTFIYKTFPFEDADKAHELMASSEHTGKIILVKE